jgi:hypothetical protein
LRKAEFPSLLFSKNEGKKIQSGRVAKIAEIIDPETSFLQTLEEAEKDFDNGIYFSTMM